MQLLLKQGKSFRASKSSYDDLFQFAESAVRLLVAARPFTIADFILRVDIMQANNGRFVVNEFESFEAFIFDPSTGVQENRCQQQLVDYYYDMFTNFYPALK